MGLPIRIAGGSVTGHAHLHAQRNNQDAFAWAETADGIIAVVCDGCGSGAHNEVGAKLGAKLAVNAGLKLLADGCSVEQIAGPLCHDLLQTIHPLVMAMGIDPAGGSSQASLTSAYETVSTYFLFTLLVCVIAQDKACVFGVGDGLVVINSDVECLGPFPNNEPPYIGYDLLAGCNATPSDEWVPSFSFHRTLPLADVRVIALGTDGAADLVDRPLNETTHDMGNAIVEICQDERVFNNSDMVRRKLLMMQRLGRRTVLADDTTLVLVRREREIA